MFVNLGDRLQFAPERPTKQLIHDHHDARLILFGLEPGQIIPEHASSSSVIMQVLEGTGRIQVGTEERSVRPGDVVICPPHVPHALVSGESSRFAVLAVITPRP